MIKPTLPKNEAKRLAALLDYDILDTLPEEAYDDITKIASEICQKPISLVSLIDSDRQWFKSHFGLEATETSRDLAFCAHALHKPDEILEVPDSRKDQRFINNPLVEGEPNVIFYAGAPLVTPEGYTLGTLCVIDNKPGKLDQRQKTVLKALANQVVAQLELRKKISQLEQTKKELKEANSELEQFAHVASHDIKSPLTKIIAFAQLLKKKYSDQFDNEGSNFLNIIEKNTLVLHTLVDGILDYTKQTRTDISKTKNVDTKKLIQDSIDISAIPEHFSIKLTGHFPMLKINNAALQQIFLNLINNAIKYSDKEKGLLTIEYKKANSFHIFRFQDNGPGIDTKNFDKIFTMFQTLGKKDRFGQKGSGIGLATVKKLIEKMQGNISVSTNPGKGTTFTIGLPLLN